MIKGKAVSALLAVIFTLFSIPTSYGTDIPYLTWERGREQNVVASKGQNQTVLQVKLVQLGVPTLDFKVSKPNAKGFSVYSVFLPEDTPLGEYEIYVYGDSSLTGTLVAKVKIIGLDRYSIITAPNDFVFLLLALMFITTVLSVARGRKYKYLSFPRQKTAAESGTLLHEKSIPRVIYPAFLMRTGAMNSFRPSLFRFLLICDDTLLHKISPLLWTLFPILSFALGLQSGYSTNDQLPNIPIYSLAAISIVGMLDAYSGIFALFGFAVGQIVTTNVSNLREVMVIAGLALSWIMPSLFGNLLYFATERDYPKLMGTSKSSLKNLSLLATTSAIVGSFFYASQLFIAGISLRASQDHPYLVTLSLALGLCFLLKTVLREWLDNWILRGGRKDSLVLEVFSLDLFISHSWVVLIGASSGFSTYVITENLAVSVVATFATFVFFGALNLRVHSTSLHFAHLWKRNIYYEAFAMTSAAAILIYNIQSLPFQARDKSLAMLAISFGLSVMHAIFSSIHEFAGEAESAREKHSAKDLDLEP
jgi:hypothetical protein